MLNQLIAEIKIDPSAKQIKRISCHATHITFKCKRCGVFCCKLGGPKLSKKDTDRLKQAGKETIKFLIMGCTALRTRENGSCVFLSHDETAGLSKCSVYNFRPTLCRLYPFRLERSGRNSYTLLLIPCCNGLNTENGESLDRNFIANTIGDVLFKMRDAGLL